MQNQFVRLVRQLDAKAWDRLAVAVNAILVVLLAHTFARLTWVVLPTPEQAPPPAASAPAAQTPTDYRQIAALHLFGQTTQAPARNAPIDAPETRLNLSLRGILFNTDPQLTRAIISAPGRDDDIYRVGDQIADGTVIDQIYADRVMLLRNGRHETLRLPEQSGGAAGAPRRQRDATEGLATIRRDIIDNPQDVATYIQAVPVNRSGGGILGFRVRPGQDPAVFQLSGLQEGDIVTAVNGVRLDSIDKAADVLGQLASSDVVNVGVLRNGAEFTLQIQLQNTGSTQ